MPGSASSWTHRPEDLISRLRSVSSSSSNTTEENGEAKLKVLRELKTKLLEIAPKSCLTSSSAPSLPSSILSHAVASQQQQQQQSDYDEVDSLLVQSAAAIGSFACGVDLGVKAVLDAGAFTHLLRLISHPNDKLSSLVDEGKFLHVLRGCPQILSCFGEDVSFEDGRWVYNLLLEYAPGGTLGDLIKSRRGKKLVGMKEVDAAIQEMFQAPHIQVMRSCSRLSKIFLAAMVHELYKTGMSETTFEKLAITTAAFCTSNGEAFPGWDTLLKISCKLGESRIILCEAGARHRLQKLQLNFPSDDVTFALKDSKELPWLAKYL